MLTISTNEAVAIGGLKNEPQPKVHNLLKNNSKQIIHFNIKCNIKDYKTFYFLKQRSLFRT